MRSGFLFVISGPSAVGKSTIADRVLADKSINRIITCTTRKIRGKEVDGVDYNFISVDDFLLRKNNGDFIESSEVYGNYYGVPLSAITKNMEQGIDSLLVINWEGFLKIKSAVKKNIVGFFIAPPSMKDLEDRIRARSADSEEIIARRLSAANEDMSHKDKYDFCIKNVSVEETANDILQKIRSIRETMIS